MSENKAKKFNVRKMIVIVLLLLVVSNEFLRISLYPSIVQEAVRVKNSHSFSPQVDVTSVVKDFIGDAKNKTEVLAKFQNKNFDVTGPSSDPARTRNLGDEAYGAYYQTWGGITSLFVVVTWMMSVRLVFKNDQLVFVEANFIQNNL